MKHTATRFVSALLLLLYTGGQPAVLCAADCLLGRHVASHVSHTSHHHESAPTEPCHTGQVTAGATVSAAMTAVAASPPDVTLAVSVGRVSDVVPAEPYTPTQARTPSLDTPPPKRLIAA